MWAAGCCDVFDAEKKHAKNTTTKKLKARLPLEPHVPLV